MNNLDHEPVERVTAANGERRWWQIGRRAAPEAETISVAPASSRTVDQRISDLRETGARRQRAIRATVGGAVCVGVGLGAFALAAFLNGLPPILNAPHLWLPAALVIGGEAVVLCNAMRGVSALRTAVNALANEDDVRAIGPLAQIVGDGGSSRPVAIAALTRILGKLEGSEAAEVGDEGIEQLGAALRHVSDPRRLSLYDGGVAETLRQALVKLNAADRFAGTELRTPTAKRLRAPGDALGQFRAAVRQRKRNLMGIAIGAVVGAASALDSVLSAGHVPDSAYLCFLLCGIGCTAATVIYSSRGAARLNAMMRALVDERDVTIIGPLLEIAAVPDSTTQPMAALLLTRLLRSLRASDRDALTPAQHEALIRSLSTAIHSPEFVIAALNALEQIGDERAIPTVERIAAGKTLTAERERIRAAASACLPFLQTRYDLKRASSTLLRGSAPGAPPALLLRAAEAASGAGDADLLQPTVKPDEDAASIVGRQPEASDRHADFILAGG